MKKIPVTLVLTLAFVCAIGQHKFIGNVKVEYEKVVYLRQLLTDMWGKDIANNFGTSTPVTLKKYFNLTASTDQSYYEPGRESEHDKSYWNNLLASANVVHSDLKE